MRIADTEIEDTFAEAFDMKCARLIVTATDDHWLEAALREFCGYATSVIGCDAEIGCEGPVPAAESVDGRQGASILAFGFSSAALGKAVVNRTGQCLMTCPTSSVFDGLPESGNCVDLGKHLRFFGDGFQKSKLLNDRRYWRIPVMDGEFIVEDRAGIARGVGGGNFLIQSIDQQTGLHAARRAVSSIENVRGAITPFPGGVARSGSKVGSRYKSLVASTADAFCPHLRGRVDSAIHPDATCVYEIVIDGIDRAAIAESTRQGIRAAIGPGVLRIGAGNYGGKLGKHNFHLRQLLNE